MNSVATAPIKATGVKAPNWLRQLWVGFLFSMCCVWMSGGSAADWGIKVQDAPEGRAAAIIAVSPGSPAFRVGLQPGDRIERAQNFLVRNAGEFELILRTERIDSLLLRVSRDGWEKDVRLVQSEAQKPAKAWLGLQVSDPPPDSRGALVAGALIIGMAADGPSVQAGLKAGDLITNIEGRPVDSAAALASLLEDWPAGKPMRLSVTREGWSRDVAIKPGVQPDGVTPIPARPEPSVSAPSSVARGNPPVGNATSPQSVPVAPQSVGNKALVAVGDFRVKAATANQAIGDGLREMLLTALYRSGSYVVVERMDIQGLAAEQALSRSRMAREGSAVPPQQMDVADIMVYGAVTEFEGGAKGSSFQVAVPRAPLSLGHDSSTAHMAIDIRVVDVSSGRILGAERIVGDAKSSQSSIGGAPTVRGVGIPASLGIFSNTPMEEAIRNCVDRAVGYVSATVPPSYFRHR